MRYDRYDDIEERVEREAVLSIPRPWRPAYFAVFTLQLIWWLSITIYLEAGVPEYRNWQANMVGIMRAMSPLDIIGGVKWLKRQVYAMTPSDLTNAAYTKPCKADRPSINARFRDQAIHHNFDGV